MPKVTILDLQNLDNPNSAVSTINLNFNNIQDVIETLLSRDGTSPNAMLANLDMNAYRILNLPAPTSPTEPARHGDIQQYVDRAEEAAEAAEAAQEITEEARDETVEAYEDFLSRYIGSFSTPPLVDGTGQPLETGAIYWNTLTNQLFVFTIDAVVVGADRVVVGSDRLVVSYWVPIPQTTLRSLTDVSAPVIVNNQFLMWSGGKFVPQSPSADFITFDPDGTMFNGDDVQTALEEVSTRTSLGIYDISLWAEGLPGDGEVLFRMVVSREFLLPVNLTGSVAVSRLPAAADTNILFKRNGVQFGSAFFAATYSEGVMLAAGNTTFEAGDILSIEAPTPADTNLRDISITLAARR